ncbi:MAG: four helix bundle protein [Bacteroidota bacterium]
MGGGINTHRDLVLYRKAVVFVSSIYKMTQTFPAEERFALVSQLRRASVSVPTNIAEGSARNSTKELIQFLYISLGSISEIETLLQISKNLLYIDDILFIKLNKDLSELRKMTSSLICRLKT